MPSYYHLRDRIKPQATRDKVIDKLLRLRKRLDKYIPPKDADHSLLLATWNIRDFDKPWRRGFGPRLPESLFYIAEIISRFDMVAVQEVNRLGEWERVMDVLGPSWGYIATDVTDTAQGGNGERMLFVYDRRKVVHQHIAGEIVLPTSMLISRVETEVGEDKFVAGKQFRRTPFVASFQAGTFKFDICTVHIYYGASSGDRLNQRVEEIDAIASYLSDRADISFKDDRATILLGDFNIVHPEHKTMNALLRHKFRVPKDLQHPTNVIKTKYYDQIAFKTRRNILEFIDSNSSNPLHKNAGVFDLFGSAFKTSQRADYEDAMRATSGFRRSRNQNNLEKYYRDWRTFQLSDHNPLWVRLKVNESETYLKSLQSGA